jgi:hypothetical protein
VITDKRLVVRNAEVDLDAELLSTVRDRI